MKQYTTKWANEVLRLFPDAIYLRQKLHTDLITKDGRSEIILLYAVFLHFEDDYIFLQNMLEHPNGWKNSKVTREEKK